MKINCHCHIFSPDCVPLDLRSLFLGNVSNPTHNLVHKLLRKIIPSDTHYGRCLELIDMSIHEIAEKFVLEMDKAGIDIATPLMMDMDYCRRFKGGNMKYEDQIVQTVSAADSINERYGRTRLLPFISADPRRPGVADLVINTLNKKIVYGVKIYPVMGYIPSDKKLFPIYEYCAKNHIPVTTHCQNGGIPGFQDYYHLADPEYWLSVLDTFPQLILNLAHNDKPGTEWQKQIEHMIVKYENVYTDISYATAMFYNTKKFFTLIKKMLGTPKVRDRILYGTDWYMNYYLWTETSYLKWFTDYSKTIPWCRITFNEEELNLILEKNPIRFLGLRTIS